MERILVTGGTGNNGKAVLEHLAKKGVRVRAMLRDPSKAAVLAESITYVPGDFDDDGSLQTALADIDVAFLVTAYEPTFPEKHAAFIQAAQRTGVRHVVQLSGVGADAASPVQTLKWLGQAEAHLRKSNLSWTILRAGTFHSNFYASAGTIAEQGIIAGPFGAASDATLTLVDNRDIGAVAGEILLDPAAHRDRIYTLTGSELLNYSEIAAIFSKVLSKEVVYTPISDEEAKEGLLHWQVPDEIADSLVQLWAAMRIGLLRPPLSNDVQRILGRKPISFEQFVRDEADRFSYQQAR